MTARERSRSAPPTACGPCSTRAQPTRQSFIAAGAVEIEDGPAIRGSYGDLRGVRVRTRSESLSTFVYPRTLADPAADAARQSLGVSSEGFQWAGGRVSGNLYVGRQSAGGFGTSLDLNGDDKPEVTFDAPCGFLLQIQGTRVMAVEADRDVNARVVGRRLRLRPHVPQQIQ